MIALTAENLRELPRWLLSGAVVLMLHGAIAAGLVQWSDWGDPDEPSGGLVVDLAPMPASPDLVPAETPPGPEQVQAEAAPEKPVETVEETPEEKVDTKPLTELQPELAPAVNPEVVVAELPPQPQKEQPTPEVNQVPAPATTAPQVLKLEEAVVAAAPIQAAPSISDSNAIPTWKRQIVSLLERNKRYPAAAQSRGERGTAELEFSLDRQGRVTASRILRSSGSAALDQETLELVRRAQPFPPPPATMPGAQVELTVPIRFNIR
jgi:protein TonB